jgi:hypothetical protein
MTMPDSDGYCNIPNPDKPVEAKRKSRFIGELNIEY